MNYFEHHIGDYDSATAHLSVLEDGIYSRMLRLYYRTEQALPLDVRQICRLIRAASKQERDAVNDMLAEFFEKRDDGFHQVRCDEEIGRFHDKQRKARASAEARWGAVRTHADDDANASAKPMRTHSGRNADGMHRAPVPSPQSPDPIPKTQSAQPDATTSRAPVDVPGHEPTKAGLACRAMKAVGLAAVNPGDPRLIALCEQGATLEEFSGLAEEAVAKGKGFAWVLVALEARRREAADLKLTPQHVEAWDATRSGMERRAAELGLQTWVEREQQAINAGRTPDFPAWERELRRADANARKTAA